jgi:arylsulfatase A-like enzyme
MSKKPNVILLMADQLRPDFVGTRFTPNINRLISESFSFSRAYCAAPLCVPARGTFYNGLYPSETGCILNPWHRIDAAHGRVREGVKSFFDLSEPHWDCWHVGKMHYFTEENRHQLPSSTTHYLADMGDHEKFNEAAGKRVPGGAGFSALMPESALGNYTRAARYSIPTTGCYEPGYDHFFDGYFTNEALKTMKQRDKTKSYLLHMMFVAPHPPFDIPEPWYSMYKNEDVPMADNVGVWGKKQSPLTLYHLPGHAGSHYTRKDWQEPWRVYAGLVSLLDHCVGELVKELKEQGMYDDSLILFTADHGEMLGSHCLWQKMCMYEESLRVPLSFKLPGGKHAGEKSDELVSHVDMLPTLCDLLDLETPSGISGRSLVPQIQSGTALDREWVFAQYDGNGARGNFQRCLVQGRYKLIVDLFRNETFFELYDVDADPQEMKNLAFEDRERVLKMIGILEAEMKRQGDLIQIPKGAYPQFLDVYPKIIDR